MKRKHAAPTAVPPPTPTGLDGLAPALAVAYLAMALATIPYGKPPATWYTWLMAGTGLACVSAALFDPRGRRRQLTLWPIPVILGAWGLSIMGCQFPAVSFERSIGMGLYSLVFVAAQVVTWSPRTRDYLMLTVFLVVGACALDITWQRFTWHSLYSDSRQVIHSQASWGRLTLRGSQGNANDWAAVSVLLPLSSSLVPGRIGMVVYIVQAILASTTWIFSESRQVLLGWLIGLLGPVGARLPRKWAIAIALLTLLMLAVAVFALTPLRKRFLTMWDNPLGSRGPVILYGLDLFTRSPVFGTGPGLFGHYYVVGVREGWSFRSEVLPAVGMPWVHSIPIEILCETGLTSAAAYAAAALAAVRRLWAGIRQATQDREWLIALSTSVACFGVMSLVDMSFIKDWVRIVFWLLGGLCFAAAPVRTAAVQIDAPKPKTRRRPSRAS